MTLIRSRSVGETLSFPRAGGLLGGTIGAELSALGVPVDVASFGGEFDSDSKGNVSLNSSGTISGERRRLLGPYAQPSQDHGRRTCRASSKGHHP